MENLRNTYLMCNLLNKDPQERAGPKILYYENAGNKNTGETCPPLLPHNCPVYNLFSSRQFFYSNCGNFLGLLEQIRLA